MSSKKMSRRDFLRASAGATAAAAVGTLTGAAAAAPRAQGEAIVLTEWAFADNRAEWQREVIAELWDNPDVTFDIQNLPWEEIWTKLQTVFVAGTGAPDIVELEVSQWGQYATGDDVPFVALNDHIGDEMENLVEAAATAPWTKAGNIYGIGNEVNPVLFYYRGDIADELGIDFEAPATWDELAALAPAVKEGGYELGALPVDGWETFFVQLTQAGGDFFDAEGNVTANSDLAVEVLSWQQDQLRNQQNFIDQPNPQWPVLLEDGYITLNGAPWFQGFMKQNMPEQEGLWRMRLMPLWDEGGVGTASRGGTGMGITNQSPNADAAWEFIRVCNLTVDGCMLGFRRLNLFPSYIPTWEEEDLYRTDDYFSGQTPAEYIAAAAETMGSTNLDPYFSLLTGIVTRLAIGPVLLEGADPAESLNAVVDEFEFSK